MPVGVLNVRITLLCTTLPSQTELNCSTALPAFAADHVADRALIASSTKLAGGPQILLPRS